MNFRDTIEGYIKEKNSNSRGTYAPRLFVVQCLMNQGRVMRLKVSELFGETTEYEKKQEVEIFIRIGNESVVANAAELKRLVLRGKSTSFDSLITDYEFSDYSAE